MDADKQISLVQQFFEECFHGNVAEAAKVLDPDVVYHVPGSHKLAGDFRGPEAAARHVSELRELTGDRVDVVQWEDWLVGINHIAGVVRVRMQKRSQIEQLRAVYLLAMTDDAKIRRIEIFFADQLAAERFLA